VAGLHQCIAPMVAVCRDMRPQRTIYGVLPVVLPASLAIHAGGSLAGNDSTEASSTMSNS
jgi:hypothetical protein